MDQNDYPALYVMADSASLWGQRWHRRIIGGNLVFIIVGSIFAYIADNTSGPLRVVAAVISALSLIVGVLPRKLHGRVRDDKHWFEGRAIAETAKSLAWRYMMRVPPFDRDVEADTALLAALDEVRTDVTGVDEIRSATIDGEQITPRMRDIRSGDLWARRDFYARERLENQMLWYSRKSVYNAQREKLWSRVNVASELAAIVVAIGVIFSPALWVNAVGVFAAVTVAATAWTQLGQHSLLTKSYGLAAQELERIRTMTLASTTEEELWGAVRNGEGAVSREHTLWTAKRNDSLAPVV
jgi:hypothetical protein